ncbi:MAG: ABC transporter permease [Alphaproteobacteria bacterium]|nr:MAG: ABC transporter permease [Alphaproteobacteria bacterium]
MSLAPPPVARRRYSLGGVIAIGFWALVLLGLAFYLVSSFNPMLIQRYGWAYLNGLGTTVTLVLTAFVIGAILSLPIALGRKSDNGLARGTSFVFVYFFRGTPLIAQIFLVYYGFGQFRPQLEAVGLWWFFREAWSCAVFSLALNTAAYQAEILRGAIESVPKGQWEGARSLGLSTPVIFWKVILPQAMIVALRPYANEIILMIKASAIVAIITVYDLMGETRLAYSRSYDFQTYIYAALFYLAIVEVLRNLTALAERRLIRHLKR